MFQTTTDQKYLKRNGLQPKFYQKEESYGRPVYVEIELVQEVEWINVIAERKDNGRVHIYSKLGVNLPNTQQSVFQPSFNERIVEAIENELAYTASDASVKNGQMAGC